MLQPAHKPTRQRKSLASSGSDGETGDNDSPGAASHIKVVVRVRPENKTEREGGYGTVVRVLDENLLVFDPKEEGSPGYYHGHKRKGRDFTKKKNRDIRFAFDSVFDVDLENREVYEKTTKCILDGLLDGYNCSVFAYGATGAGKTHTMLGNKANPGITFHTMMELYERIEMMKQDKICDVAVSYLEVYNEQIRDLLMPSGFLPVREDPQRGVVVGGLSLHKPKNAEELLHMLEFGNLNRTQHPTDANSESSRSHAVFQVFVRQRDRTANLSTDVRVAKMCLIDLAGSERATVTTNRGDRFREGANINRSLLALGNCINSLAEGKSKGYVPYRNSKLTRLLKDSLGGNCRTVMIAAVSPSSMTYEDTYNTLKYADRAKNIKATLKRNVVSVDFHVVKYAKIVEELRMEVAELKGKLRAYEDDDMVTLATKPVDTQLQQDTDKLVIEMQRVFHERQIINKEMHDLEIQQRDLTFKIHRKERYLARIPVFIGDRFLQEKLTCKARTALKKVHNREQNCQMRKQPLQDRKEHNTLRLKKVEQDMRELAADGRPSEVFELNLCCQQLELQRRDTQRHVKHLQKLCKAQETEIKSSERLVLAALATVRRQFFLLKSYGLVTEDMSEEFEEIQKMIQPDANVSWTDPPVSLSICQDTSLSENNSGTVDNFSQLLDLPVEAIPKTPQRQKQRRTPGTTPRRRRGRRTPGSEMPKSSEEVFCSPEVVVSKTPVATPRCSIMKQVMVKDQDHDEAGNSHGGHQEAHLASVSGDNQLNNVYAGRTPFSKGPGVHVTEINECDQDVESDVAMHDRQNIHRDKQNHSHYVQTNVECSSNKMKPPASLPLEAPTLPANVESNSQHSHQHGVSHASHLQSHKSQIPSATQVPHSGFANTKELHAMAGDHEMNETFTLDDDCDSSSLVPGILPLATPAKDGTQGLSQPIGVTVTKQKEAKDDTQGLSQPMGVTVTKQQEGNQLPLDQLKGTLNIHRDVLQQQIPINGRDTDNKPINRTVTKGKPTHESLLDTHMSPKRQDTSQSNKEVARANGSRINSCTVTKRPHTPESCGKEPSSPKRRSVVRCMDFADVCPTPPGGRSFADVVKSPAPSHLQQQEHQTPRSPLMSCENLPRPSPVLRLQGHEDKDFQFAKPKAPSVHHKSHLPKFLKTRQTTALHRLGLPSMVEKPGYMQMTKAASGRSRHHRRSSSAQGSSHQRRKPPVDENATSGDKMPRWRSSNALPQSQWTKKSTFF